MANKYDKILGEYREEDLGISDHSLLSKLDYASAAHTGFQPTLVSGTNIKTINSNSLLGSGDLAISTPPGGSNTQVQFNDGGAFGGDAGLTYNKTTDVLTVLGKIGIGQTPTAVLHLKAGTATANTAPLKLTTGTLLTTPEAGAIEFNGTDIYITLN